MSPTTALPAAGMSHRTKKQAVPFFSNETSLEGQDASLLSKQPLAAVRALCGQPLPQPGLPWHAVSWMRYHCCASACNIVCMDTDATTSGRDDSSHLDSLPANH
jgi:hypothetical protein